MTIIKQHLAEIAERNTGKNSLGETFHLHDEIAKLLAALEKCVEQRDSIVNLLECCQEQIKRSDNEELVKILEGK